MRKALLLGALLLAAGPPLLAQGSPDACVPREVKDMGPACLRPDGLWEVFGPDGESLGTTHGPDPLEPGVTPNFEPMPLGYDRPPHCVDGAPGEYYALVIYARAYNDADRYATHADVIRGLVETANGLVYFASATTGRPADLKVHCTGGEITVVNAVLPTPMASARFSTIVSDLRNMGYTDGKVKHWVYYDDRSACSCGGQGHIYNDDRASEANWNNGNGGALYAITYGYDSPRIMLHELGHNLGAVQLSAPHSTGGWHCTDGNDIMCYNDGGPTANQYRRFPCAVELFDCLQDDYMNSTPLPTTYLATHWNLGAPYVRYLEPAGL